LELQHWLDLESDAEPAREEIQRAALDGIQKDQRKVLETILETVAAVAVAVVVD
jgi:hypothetical protein